MKSVRVISALLLLVCCAQLGAQPIRLPYYPKPYQIPFLKPGAVAPDTVNIAVIGDVMMHARQLECDHRTFLAPLSGALRGADVAVANLEFALGGKPYSGYPSFSTPDYYAWYLAGDCGIDVFLTANNHVLDRGAAGLQRTLKVYAQVRDSLGVQQTGAARDAQELDRTYPLMLLRKGIRIALVNFTYGTNYAAPQDAWPAVNRMDKAEVGAAIRRAREQGADFVVALPHWGTEYRLRHDAAQQQWAQWLAAQGVDAVVGAHPHVVQDTTHIQGVPVIYSLGNAVSNMSVANSRIGLMAVLRFVCDPLSGEKRMLEPELRFIWCTLPGKLLPDSYSSLFIKEWASRRGDWLTPDDFDRMMSEYRNVKDATGIRD